MRVYEAPNEPEIHDDDVICFLAGGISKCWDWQSAVIKAIEEDKRDTSHLVLLNPRRANFPMDRPEEAYNQISWEKEWLDKSDIFSMYFCNSESVQPICMYELGRHLALPHKARVISMEHGYSREYDVIAQSILALNDVHAIHPGDPKYHAQNILAINDVHAIHPDDPKYHAQNIIYEYQKIIGEK